jgi:hypothetical protein
MRECQMQQHTLRAASGWLQLLKDHVDRLVIVYPVAAWVRVSSPLGYV